VTIPEWSSAPAAAAIAALAFWLNRKVFGFLPDDPPDAGRKQHGRPVPLAGVVLLPVVAVALIATQDWLLLAAAVLASLVGYGDDRGKERGRGLPARSKGLGLLLVAALVAVRAVPDVAAAPERFALAWLLAFVLTNACNFLDNTDGVSAALCGTSLLLASGGSGALGAAGFAALGFLPWNWPRPWLFLGDAGALLLGTLVAAASTAHLPELAATVLPVAVQLADFVQVVLARLVLGRPPWVGDRRHLTHVAQNLGLPPVLVAPLFAAIAVAASQLPAAGVG